MSEGRILKPDKDFSKEADKQIPEAEKLAKASDLASTSRLVVAIVTICKDSGDWSLLNEQVLLLSKKHGQLKQATTKMVQVVMTFIDDAPTKEKKLSVIETLRTVTEGKIFVEVERARVTRILSNMKKEEGDLPAAADILCELQVETFGSMERREKTEFILEQVALCIERGDWTQAGILSRKISTRYFARKPKLTPEQIEQAKKDAEKRAANRSVDDPPERPDDDVTDLKLRFYEQQITLAKQEDKYLDACKHYRQVLDTESVEQNAEQLRAVLQRVIYYVILAPHSNEQSDLLHRIHTDSRNAQIVPLEASLLKLFTVPELMRWPNVSKQFGPPLCETDVFSATEPSPSSSSTAPFSTSPSSSPSSATDPKAHKRYTDLRKRVIEHNVRVIAKYYTRIGMQRLTELLDLDEGETERYISELVTSGTIYARIDRPARLISFRKARDADEVLNEWSGDMKSLLGLLERIDHLITKEEMMARIQKVR
ncbi:hypothetical protein MMC25_001971 [Agyrium rufum]|nr:hypothetical protein [Agyrium rufum]